jgi:hypothetical protein
LYRADIPENSNSLLLEICQLSYDPTFLKGLLQFVHVGLIEQFIGNFIFPTKMWNGCRMIAQYLFIANMEVGSNPKISIGTS